MSASIQVMGLGRAWGRGKESGDRTAQYHARLGWVYEDDWYQKNHEMNIYWLFQSHAEWGLGNFLVENLMQIQINVFLKLDWLKGQKPSFSSACQLLEWTDTLSSGLKWQVKQLKVNGYNTEKKIRLMYRDGLEVVEKHKYGEWFTAHEATCIQDTLPEGATIIPIIAASDKMPVMKHTGNLEMHPLFLTIANIDSDIHMKATAHAWHCVAFMLIIKFNVHPDYQTILQAQLWHRCIDIVMERLKHVANVGEFMMDAFSDIQFCFTLLVAWMADLLEQQLIAAVARNASPITLVTLEQFRDPTCQPPHTKQSVEQGAEGTLGRFLVPKVLHSLHNFFWDHVLKWCKEVVGIDELNTLYKVHHKCIGFHHFASGISHATQMTGCEYHDIQHTIVPMITGAAPAVMVQPICTLMDFIYLAQRHVHTESSIRDMEASLAKFHSTKNGILATGAHAGKVDFNIPKLELMLNFMDAIRRNGGLIQYSANVSEHLLITHCNMPFTQTNRQSNFTEQIICLLDCEECICLFDVYLLLHEHNKPLGLMSKGTVAVLSIMITPDHVKLKITDIGTTYALPNFFERLNEYVMCHVESIASHIALQMFDGVSVWPSVIMLSQVVQAQPPSPDFPHGNCNTVLLNVDGQNPDNPNCIKTFQ
ncbi:hypothetical protein F5J12DRAFT_786314 [Pisolithus orientalis]|uniref:uncharacterized protein n=1 Tax=Pisolithus orientalis TaxID=936130 RepID=UPI0022254A38|nr:uncharacterized protein F5J12DRAFT_786314 [Pisolithus orientalis]KAI5991668.1 hypothetical protein F5J12DRAFT_786314 [Pisolithus orientalis]